jgi:hypothetical protein
MAGRQARLRRGHPRIFLMRGLLPDVTKLTLSASFFAAALS